MVDTSTQFAATMPHAFIGGPQMQGSVIGGWNALESNPFEGMFGNSPIPGSADSAFMMLNGGTQSVGQSFVDPLQQNYLGDIYGQAANINQAIAPASTAQGFNLANGLTGIGQGFLGGLGQNAGQQITPFLSQSAANDQIDSLADILNRNLGQNLAGIERQGAAFGQLGGGRTQVAQGQAIGDNQLALAAGASQIMNDTLNRQGNLAVGQAGIQANSALGGLTALPGQFDLGMAGFSNAFAPLMSYANIVGRPTVLDQRATESYHGQGLSGNLNDAANTGLGSAVFGF